jgi:predicted N-acetyltransferase YhbS
MNIEIRPATKIDLDAINRVVEAAMMTWNLPERVKRLSLPSYRYTNIDFEHLDVVVAEDDQQNIIGVAAWERADTKDAPAEKSALLLHGIYVVPVHQQNGIGRRLFKTAEAAVRIYDYDGLLVKAQDDANGFFISQGMTKLKSHDPVRDYANRFWKAIDP